MTSEPQTVWRKLVLKWFYESLSCRDFLWAHCSADILDRSGQAVQTVCEQLDYHQTVWRVPSPPQLCVLPPRLRGQEGVECHISYCSIKATKSWDKWSIRFLNTNTSENDVYFPYFKAKSNTRPPFRRRGLANDFLPPPDASEYTEIENFIQVLLSVYQIKGLMTTLWTWSPVLKSIS